MARKIPGLRRVLDERSLASVAYGEIASSLYFALGIVASYALGFTPEVLLVVGVLFLLVSLSYAEGTSALPETGGAATLVRRTFNDLAGFMTGWVLFLDYLIVMALSALFLPHYLAAAISSNALAHHPWDEVAGAYVIAGVGVIRLFRRPGFYSVGVVVAIIDLVTQLVLAVFGFALLFSGDALTKGTSLGTHPSWHAIVFALPLAMLAYTGLETVANLSEEARRPGIDIPRALFGAIAVVVVLYLAIALVGLSAFPARGGHTELGATWQRSPLVGIAEAFPDWLDGTMRVFVGLSGTLVLLAAATTSISGFGRLAYSLGEHGQLPRAFGRLGRRTLIAPESILAAVVISIGLLVGTAFLTRPVPFLASLFSFGVLLAFAAAQIAVVSLRFREPDLARPYRVPFGMRVRGAELPVPALVGLVST